MKPYAPNHAAMFLWVLEKHKPAVCWLICHVPVVLRSYCWSYCRNNNCSSSLSLLSLSFSPSLLPSSRRVNYFSPFFFLSSLSLHSHPSLFFCLPSNLLFFLASKSCMMSQGNEDLRFFDIMTSYHVFDQVNWKENLTSWILCRMPTSTSSIHSRVWSSLFVNDIFLVVASEEHAILSDFKCGWFVKEGIY